MVLGEAHSQKIRKKKSGFGRGAAKPELFVIFWEFEPESYKKRGEKRRLQIDTPFAIQSKAGRRATDGRSWCWWIANNLWSHICLGTSNIGIVAFDPWKILKMNSWPNLQKKKSKNKISILYPPADFKIMSRAIVYLMLSRHPITGTCCRYPGKPPGQGWHCRSVVVATVIVVMQWWYYFLCWCWQCWHCHSLCSHSSSSWFLALLSPFPSFSHLDWFTLQAVYLPRVAQEISRVSTSFEGHKKGGSHADKPPFDHRSHTVVA